MAIKIKFIMLVGLPASGKTTLASHYKNKCEVLSSDDIRIELFGMGNGFTRAQNATVFDTMLKRTKQAMSDGKSVVYDATNLSRGRRMNTLQQLKTKFPNAEFNCILCLAPYGVCVQRNSLRWFDKVPDDVMEHMYRSFEIPCMQEGWGHITCYYSSARGMTVSDYLVRSIGFDQQNPHHAESLYDHMVMSKKYVKDHFENASDVVIDAALLHDIGKLYTKQVKDRVAHYYAHANVGAYNVLLLRDNMSDKMYTALLVELHMHPMMYSDAPELEQNDRKLFGDSVVDDLMILHEADVNSSKEEHVG